MMWEGDEWMMSGPNLWFVTEVGHPWDESGDTITTLAWTKVVKNDTPLQHPVLAHCPGELAVTNRISAVFRIPVRTELPVGRR